MAKKLGLALGAGGSRGVAHIGLLKALEEEGIKPDCIAGTSMGAVVGACYAAGLSPDYMIDVVLKLKFSDIFDLSVNPMGNGAILRAQKMRKKLKVYLKDYTFEQLKMPFTCVATDLLSGESVSFHGDDNVAESVAASASIPGIFRAVSKPDALYVDGGVKCRVPVDEVRSLGADVVVAVDVLGGVRPANKKYNLISLLLRMVDIYDAEITKYKLQSQTPDLLLVPDLGDMIQYKFKDMKMAYDKGYDIGKQNAEKIRALLA